MSGGKPGHGLLASAFRASFNARASYRGDFLFGMMVTLLFESVVPLVTVLIYGTGSSFPGWSMPQALLLQGVFLLARGIAFPCFFGVVWVVFNDVREGTFDLVLLKPRPALLVTALQGFDVQGIGRLCGGAALFAYAVSRAARPDLLHVALFMLLLVLSVLVLCALALFMAATLFVWVGNARMGEVVESLLVFAQYPGSIYGRGLQVVLSVALPVTAIAFLPAQALLGRPEPLTLIAAPACLAFTGLSVLFWRAMLRRYGSGGG